MNFTRQAVRFEMSRNSAAMLLRLYLRFQLLWIFVWAASDLFLVWYWSSRVCGPGAHEYFGRWFLAWLFTQKLPLYFLSLPYQGHRCTIGSMYAFLNWRFYLGRSFGEFRLIQPLGNDPGQLNGRRIRLSAARRPRRPSRGKAAPRAQTDLAAPALP